MGFVLLTAKLHVMKNLSLSIKNGIFIFFLVGIYFLVIDALGLIDNTFLRVLNIFLLAWGVNRAIRMARERYDSDYFESFKTGLTAAIFGIILSVAALSLYVYLFKGDGYLQTIASSLLIGSRDASLAQVSLSLLAEGLASAIVLTFGLMQYWKKTSVISENR